ncbi:MAG: hypothetical protein SNH05_04970 [Rikenellaceae bacterium]
MISRDWMNVEEVKKFFKKYFFKKHLEVTKKGLTFAVPFGFEKKTIRKRETKSSYNKIYGQRSLKYLSSYK